MTLAVVYQDEFLVAINKPSGLLVHRSMIDRHETRFALQLLRDQLGQRVYPVHRLDKPTSGVLLFALSADIAKALNQQFAAHQVKKRYLAIVRGYPENSFDVDHALSLDLDKLADRRTQINKAPQPARSLFRRLETIELPVRIDKYPSSRYALVECFPLTGRKHQLRRHLKHCSHPIIGDAKHGKGRHNRYFHNQYESRRLLLSATHLQLRHPHSQEPLTLHASVDDTFERLFKHFDWDLAWQHKCEWPRALYPAHGVNDEP